MFEYTKVIGSRKP